MQTRKTCYSNNFFKWQYTVCHGSLSDSLARLCAARLTPDTQQVAHQQLSGLSGGVRFCIVWRNFRELGRSSWAT